MREVIDDIDRALMPSKLRRALIRLLAGAALIAAGIIAEHLFGIVARLTG
jgi:hypothetical protein